MASGLATRCPACGTVFRVVPDQLRVSEGWVRCGRCSEVFNAAQALVDMETGEPHRLAFQAPVAAASPVLPAAELDTVAELEEPPVIDRAESRFLAAAAPAADDVHQSIATPALPEPEPEPEPEPGPTPSFVRRAERAQRWRQPRVRAALAGLGLLSTLTLAAQAVYEYRDSIAARLPAARPALLATCHALGCDIDPAHAIETLGVENSGLVRVEKSSLYRLTVVLRNRAVFDVALPALELTLTDGQGKLVARRVLRPAEMGTSQLTLGAGRDLTLQSTLQMATEPVAGYTVELFYP